VKRNKREKREGERKKKKKKREKIIDERREEGRGKRETNEPSRYENASAQTKLQE
jgi:hypothetical protein